MILTRHAGTKTIKTARLTLRKIELDDADAIFRNWANDDAVSRYMRWPTHKNVEETKTNTKSRVDGYKEDNYYYWGICLENGELIGAVSVVMAARDDFKAEIGYCIGRKWWGQGYASEAVKAVIGYMFAKTDIERIEAYHSIENPASGKVMAHAGMRHEGFARHKYKTRDGFQDCNLYGIIRDEAMALNASAETEIAIAPNFGRRLPYRGMEYMVGGVAGRKAFFENAFCVPVNYSSEQIKAACIRIYRDLARQDLTAKAQYYAAQLGVEPPELKINSSMTSMGSCTKTLNFSWRLVMADDSIIDYVVVHTLAQLIEPSSSSSFWKIIEGVLPDFMEYHRMLLEFKKQLPTVEV